MRGLSLQRPPRPGGGGKGQADERAGDRGRNDQRSLRDSPWSLGPKTARCPCPGTVFALPEAETLLVRLRLLRRILQNTCRNMNLCGRFEKMIAPDGNVSFSWI